MPPDQSRDSHQHDVPIAVGDPATLCVGRSEHQDFPEDLVRRRHEAAQVILCAFKDSDPQLQPVDWPCPRYPADAMYYAADLPGEQSVAAPPVRTASVEKWIPPPWPTMPAAVVERIVDDLLVDVERHDEP